MAPGAQELSAVHGAFGTVVWVVGIAGAVVAVIALLATRDTWRDFGKDALLIGSSDLAVNLGALGLIDEYRLMVNPIAIGTGKPVLQGLTADLGLELLRTRTFKNGNVLLSYAPKR